MRKILSIAVPSPLRRLFDYLPLSSNEETYAPGARVRVNFGRQTLIGMIIEIKESSDLPINKLKPIIELLDSVPVQPDYIRELALWAADYYQHPIGDAIMQSLPLHLRKGNPNEDVWHTLWFTTNKDDAGTISNRAHQQKALYQLIKEHPQGISREAIQAEGGNTSLMKTLQEKGVIESREQAFEYPTREHLLKELALPLNDEQEIALSAIHEQTGFDVSLVDGITGSGKTEVYLQAIQKTLSEKKQALVLVPEIGLTPQTLKRFEHRFRVPIGALHSGLSDKQRFTIWKKAGQGELPIIIGTRSAIFTPLKEPGIIIVDEEHDASYKQQDGFRYSARDLAILRAHAEQIPIILGSATPSLESLNNALTGRYKHLRLRMRAGNASPPLLHRLDIKGESLQNGFSNTLIKQIREHLKQENQVLVFINRRGFAPSLICHDCGWIAECNRCDARMTLHRQPAHLHCHHCNSQRPIPSQCTECGSSEIRPLGTGTERAEQTLNALFPDTPVIRVDRDSTSRKDSMSQIMEQVNSGDPCILVGTQMLAKGHHFPKVTLVAILDADSGLFSSDFRGMERTAQLITQVAGRAGRAESKGQVILQTHHADHPLLETLCQQGYEAFARSELSQRKAFHLPPYNYLAVIRAEATYAGRAESFLQSIRSLYEQALQGITWSGPFPSPMERKAGVVRSQVTLSSINRPQLQTALTWLCSEIENHPDINKVRWSIDVDPFDLY